MDLADLGLLDVVELAPMVRTDRPDCNDRGTAVLMSSGLGLTHLSWLSIILTYLDSSIDGYSLKPRKNSLFNKSMISQKLESNT